MGSGTGEAVEPRTPEAVLDACGAAVVATDAQRRVSAWNDAAADRFGWAADEVRGETPPVLPEPAGEATPAALYERAESGDRIERRPVTVRTREGAALDQLVSLQPLGTEAGDSGVVATYVTPTGGPDAQPAAARSERLTEFAGVVAHDLRSPLSTAAGALELARETGDETEFDRAMGCIERVDGVVEELLALSRGEVGEVADVPLAEVAETAWATAATADASLIIADDPTVRADAGQLRQLLENLFRNAVEHAGSPDSPGRDDGAADACRPTLAAAAAPVPDPGPAVTVRVGATAEGFFVEDDGPGIPEAERDRVFEYGYSTAPEGTGYGLTIVRRIADVHGWDVTVGEGAAGGARFTFAPARSPN